MLLTLLAARAKPQVENERQETANLPRFYFDALTFASSDSTQSRLDVYVQVPYEVLSFVQTPDGYEASYDESITILDPQKNFVREKLSIEHVKRKSFTETVEPSRYNLSQRFFTLTPGSYTLVVQVRDSETKKSMQATKDVTIRPMRDSLLTMSDLMLVSWLRVEGEKKTMVPNVTGNVASLPDGFYLFAEVYNRADCDSFDVSYRVSADKSESVFFEHYLEKAAPGKNQLFVKVPTASLSMGKYGIMVQVVGRGPSSQRVSLTASSSRSFFIRWLGVPNSPQDLDAAINQLEYLATSNELDSLKDVSSSEEKKKRFEQFWKRRDPSPTTERNEAMEQYYGRVAFANQNFSHFMDGWKTDRGMIYIMFGTPSRVDRHPFDTDAKPYEAWFYDELNYQFLFVDQTGFGDYRLDPSTPVWEIARRRR